MAELLKLREVDDPRDLIHRAVHRLVEGDLVTLPTETSEVIAANSLRPNAVARLQELAREHGTSAGEGGELLLGLKGAPEARDYVMELSQTGQRLMQRGWPGPLVLALRVLPQHGLLWSLPPASQKSVLRPAGGDNCEVWFRVPNHEVALSAMYLLPAPLIFWENRTRLPEQSPARPWESEVALIIEDQPRHNQQNPAVVRAENDSWTLVEPGALTESQLNRMMGKVILFVCTGNTCRSPLAEAIFCKLLADRLGCSPEELPERGYTVVSAGLAAVPGAPAAPESIEVARRYGATLDAHASQPLTDDLLAQADRVYTMTHSHRDSILFARPDAAERVLLLSGEDSDIPDPIGGGPREYEHCGGEISRHLKAILEDLEPRRDGDSSHSES